MLRYHDYSFKKTNNNKIGRLALRAIWFMWSDDYEDLHNLDLKYNKRKNKRLSTSAEEQEESPAFPENMLDRLNAGDEFESATLFPENVSWWIRDGTKCVEVPELSSLFKPGKPRGSFVIFDQFSADCGGCI